jgi:hypothetical protein
MPALRYACAFGRAHGVKMRRFALCQILRLKVQQRIAPEKCDML